MKKNFYCQKICGEVDFSIKEWNETAEELDKSGLSDKQKNEILFPGQCKNQCFDCIEIVGRTRIKNRKKRQNQQ